MSRMILSRIALMAQGLRLRQFEPGSLLCLTFCLFAVGAEAVTEEQWVIPETLSAGTYHTCGVKTDGTVTCWGYNNDGQCNSPTDTFTQVSAGAWHTCGVKTDGTATCWGYNYYGESDPPTGTFTQVSAGTYHINSGSGHHTCGVKTDGTVTCWGSNSYGQITPPPITNFTQVTAGGLHTCGLKTDGTVACWGYNTDGQINSPTGTFTQVSAGDYHTCGIKTDGAIACWGDNSTGQSSPPAGTFTQVNAGGYHTCGVRSDSTVACWGWNGDGQSSPPAGTFTQVSAGVWHTCGVRTSGAIACWGSNDYGKALAVIADFTGSPLSGFLPLYVSFADNSVTEPYAWMWYFGDGGVSSQMYPAHTYRTQGSYQVALAITNAAGTDVKAKDNFITVLPCPQQPVKQGINYYNTLQEAYDAAGAGALITIDAQAMVFSEELTFDTANVTVTVKGGFPCDYGLPRIPETVVQGKVTVSAGTLEADALVIQ